MPKMLSIWPQVLAVVALGLVPSCTPPEEEPVDDCRAAVSGDWESVDEFPCPLVDPSCTYRQTLNLDGTDFTWNPDDSFEGSYTCSEGMVEGRDVDGATVFTASFDAEADTLELSWDEQPTPVPYRRVP